MAQAERAGTRSPGTWTENVDIYSNQMHSALLAFNLVPYCATFLNQ